jgi:dynactin 1
MTDLAPGQRVVLSDGRHATVRFVGHAAFAAGDWVGIELDEGSGKNDGSVQGDRYFDCPMGRGMFVRPAAVTITAPAPAPAPRPVAAKRVSRPSSILGRAAGPADSGLAKRMSLNAPSPTPGPKSRPSSVIRVSLRLFVPPVSDAAVRTDTEPSPPLSSLPPNLPPSSWRQPRPAEPPLAPAPRRMPNQSLALRSAVLARPWPPHRRQLSDRRPRDDRSRAPLPARQGPARWGWGRQ